MGRTSLSHLPSVSGDFLRCFVKICDASPVNRARVAIMIVSFWALSGSAWLGCTKPVPEEKKVEQKVPAGEVELSQAALVAAAIRTGKPRVEPKRSMVRANGTIDFLPSRVARIGPNVAGKIAQISVATGQRVLQGATLFVLESVDVGRARADLLSAKSRFTQAELEVAREKKLVAGGASSDRAMLNAETEKTVAETNVRAAQERLRTLGAGGGGSSSVPITTPLSGTVLEVKARIGQPVGPTDTLVTVGEIDQVSLLVDLYERDLARVHVGDNVRVSTIAYPGKVFVGKVELLATVIDPERKVLEARIGLANGEGLLKPGMTASARILGESQDGGVATLIPKSALQSVDGLPFVFIELKPGHYRLVALEKGEEFENDVEIVRGLKGDETIVTEGAFLLKSELLKEQMGAND